MAGGLGMGKTDEVVIVGAGVMGLAIALELRLKGISVSLLCRQGAEAASYAAAGMLAPQAEELPAGAMLDLCLRSRDRYPSWIAQVEAIAGRDAGYWACGILAPRYEMPVTQPTLPADWWSRGQLCQASAALSAEVVGGWWYPQDAQVDNRKLTKALWMAVQELGAKIYEGVVVEAWVGQADRVAHLRTNQGDWRGDHYVMAMGAWSGQALGLEWALPVTPRKGQMLSVRVPDPDRLPVRTVLFGTDIYVVPRREGRIVLGATSEKVGFTPGNTPAGLQRLFAHAVRLVPAIADYEVEEFWYGYRPETPDELPILGSSPYNNLTLATGHYRNGILLTPITGELVANWISDRVADPLLNAFHWSRFASQVQSAGVAEAMNWTTPVMT